MTNLITKYHLLLLLVIVIPIFIYSSWFDFAKTLSSGDWPYLFPENIKEFEVLKPPLIWLEPYYRLTAKIGVELFSLSWETTEKLFWFLPFIIISLISSFIFINSIIKKIVDSSSKLILSIIGCLIFTTNTYVLMIVGGGQMGIAMAYAVTPAVLYYIFDILEKPSTSKKNRSFFSAVIITSLQIMFDPRIFLLTFFIIFCYVIFLLHSSNILSFNLKKIVIILISSIILNLFWIIPGIFSDGKNYNEIITFEGVDYLSFAKFSDTISLLHPNWPENIFGKIYFMRFEFILLPLIAFSFLIFNFKNNITIFFELIALIGIFLAKGANPPFGEIYLWLTNLPGFFAFRDSTKFYLLIITAYSILIPYSLLSLINWLSERIKNKTCLKAEVKNFIAFTFYGLFIIYWLFLIRFSLQGKLTGTFKPRGVPSEYFRLKDFIKNQNEQFATFWIPERQRFGFSSNIHPAINCLEIFGTTDIDKIIKEIKKPNMKDILKSQKIRYLIVPYDSEKEIFLMDRRYDPLQNKKIEKIIGSLSWLQKVEEFEKENKLTVYKIQY